MLMLLALNDLALVCTNSEASDETVGMHRLALASTVPIKTKAHSFPWPGAQFSY